MVSDRLKVSFYCTAALVSVPLAYYAAQETIRFRVMRKRRRRYASMMQALDDHSARDAVSARDEGLQATKDLFASLSILGRYSNPFAEWREEGAWEWLFWQLIWRPVTGRLFWSGGVSDAEQRKRICPSQRPNFRLLFGTEPESRDKGRLDDLTVLDSVLPTTATNLEEVHATGRGTLSLEPKQPASPDSWESLAHSREVNVTKAFTCTWLGQSTCFLTLDGLCILTDPVFSECLVSSFGPRRQRPPPAPLAHLLRIDIILVSHDHFDHLDIGVVDYLGDTAQWIVPLGLGRLLRSRGLTRIVELDWWQSTDVGSSNLLQVTCCPSMHWSARSPITTNQSLWGSFVVRGQHDTFFHCGDSGFVPSLAEQIGMHFGPISLALLPIGAYTPRWHLAPQHMDPESAVRLHKALRAKKSIGYHWGTWSLSDDRYDDPPRDLSIARELHDISEADFSTVALGHTLVLKSS